MKGLLSYAYLVIGIVAIVLYVTTYAVTCYYHNPQDTSPDNITAWWLLCIIMDRWGYFALALSVYLYTVKVGDRKELLFHLVSLAALTVCGNDLIERYSGSTSFKPVWDITMMILGLYAIIKIYKQSCRNL